MLMQVVFTFRCLELFAGPACQFRNPCFHSPCRNSATCRVITQGNAVDFVCNCRLGYTDRLCLTPTDNVCLSSPCRNGGTCELTSIHNYKCKCPPGWSGEVFVSFKLCRCLQKTNGCLNTFVRHREKLPASRSLCLKSVCQRRSVQSI